MIKLSIIVVSHNARYFTEQCLHSVRLATAGIPAEVIVIDNASTDGSIPYLQPLFREMAFVANPANTGFAAACNMGARLAKGSYLLFLNPDTLISLESLQQSMAVLDGQPKAGATGIRMVDGSGAYLPESKRGFPWLRTSLYKLSGAHKLMPAHPKIAAYYMGHLSPLTNNRIDVIAGAFFMIRRLLFDIVGGFDERYFMYGEDVDLSYCVVKAGYANYYVGSSAIIHFKGESTLRLSPQYVERFYGAMRSFIGKHYRGIKKTSYRGLVQAAAWLSTVKHKTLSLAPQPASVPFTSMLVVHAPEASITGVDNIIQAQDLPITAIRYCTPAMLMQEPVSKSDAIIFCVDKHLTIADTIAAMQRLGVAPLYLFHVIGSQSIVGSPNRQRQGVAWRLSITD